MGRTNFFLGGALLLLSSLPSPAQARFLQTDPIGYEDHVNLYAYVGNDPINNLDPSGEDCVSNNGTTICTTSVYQVSFPTQSGWMDFKSGDRNYHFNTETVSSSLSQRQTREWVNNNPTPGSPSPATRQGTVNDATPFIGGLPGNISPVKSFATINQLNGMSVVVNVTLPGHPLQSGLVVRQVDAAPNDASIIRNWGEGNGALQAPGSPVADTINSVWQDEKPPETSPPCIPTLGPGCY